MNNLAQKIPVAIVDDHFATRDGYKSLIRGIDNVDNVDTYSSATEMMNQFSARSYKLILLDTELKNEDAIDICRSMKVQYKDIKIMMISPHRHKEQIIRAEQSDADGYLFKDAEPREVMKAIYDITVLKIKYFPLEAKEIIFDHERMHRAKTSGKTPVTPRELDILRLICQGKSNKEIGKLLQREETTIAKHRQNLMRKTNTHKTVELMHYAISCGYYIPSR